MSFIGFRTGPWTKSGIPFEKRVAFFHSIGANAIELSFLSPEKFLEFTIPDRIIEEIRKYDYITMHAPAIDMLYKRDPSTYKILEKLQQLCENLPIKGIVLHPNTIDDFSVLEETGLPFLIENMDSKKTFGTHPEHIEKLKQEHDFDFVFDVQHAYENDSSMKLAKEIIDVMGNRLKHMHVSGCTKSSYHAPIYKSDNKQSITGILELGINVPKILEAVFYKDLLQSASKELSFVREYENK